MSGGGGGHGKKGVRHEEHEEHEEHVNHEAWVIPYADVLTLLMALFLVLFAIGQTDLDKFRKLAQSFRQEFGEGTSADMLSVGNGTGDSLLDGGNGILDNSGSSKPSPLQVEQAVQQAALADAEGAVKELQQIEDGILVAAEEANIGDKLAFRFEGRGLVLSLLNDGVLFRPGEATLQPEGMEVLRLVMANLKDIPNGISIEGHTDSRPISNTRYPSNWELSTSRATSVLRYMELEGFDDTRLSASGYGDTRPIADNASVDGQALNRRVEIVILSEISLKPAIEVDG
ncbi:MAG: flagellar motor protein MotB [Ilumatobacteraceae bacterium]